MRERIVNMYVLFILGIYPFLMNDGFIDISKTKSDIFLVTTGCTFVICALLSFLKKDWRWICQKKNWLIYMLIVTIGISTLLSFQPEYALTGEAGRYQGAMVCWAYCLAALCILNFGKMKNHYIDVMILAGTIVSFIAILNFYEVDILGTLYRIKVDQRHAYISTIGNINIFAAYLSVVVPAAVTKAIMEKDRWKKYVWYVCLIFLFGGMIASSCDSVYITLGTLFVFLPFGCLHDYEKRKKLSEILVVFGATIFTSSFVNKLLVYPLEYVDGMNRHFADTNLACGIFVICVIVDCVVLLTRYKLCRVDKTTWKKSWCVFVAIVGIIAVGIYTANTTFDFRWGSYRAFIWGQGVDFYLQQPLQQKLFGIGSDMIFPVFYSFFGNEGMMVDGFAFYDNLHNEYLQYLVTVGIIGLVLYLIAIGNCMRKLYQNMKENEYAWSVFIVMLCYLTQAFTNISMCCVTAVLFILLFTSQSDSEGFSSN